MADDQLTEAAQAQVFRLLYETITGVPYQERSGTWYDVLFDLEVSMTIGSCTHYYWNAWEMRRCDNCILRALRRPHNGWTVEEIAKAITALDANLGLSEELIARPDPTVLARVQALQKKLDESWNLGRTTCLVCADKAPDDHVYDGTRYLCDEHRSAQGERR